MCGGFAFGAPMTILNPPSDDMEAVSADHACLLVLGTGHCGSQNGTRKLNCVVSHTFYTIVQHMSFLDTWDSPILPSCSFSLVHSIAQQHNGNPTNERCVQNCDMWAIFRMQDFAYVFVSHMKLEHTTKLTAKPKALSSPLSTGSLDTFVAFFTLKVYQVPAPPSVCSQPSSQLPGCVVVFHADTPIWLAINDWVVTHALLGNMTPRLPFQCGPCPSCRGVLLDHSRLTYICNHHSEKCRELPESWPPFSWIPEP